MSITLIGLGVAYIRKMEVGVIILILLFVAEFELSFGPTLWVYLSETMTEKAIGLALFLNFSCAILVGTFSSVLISMIGGYTFIMFGCICFIVIIDSNINDKFKFFFFLYYFFFFIIFWIIFLFAKFKIFLLS